MMEMEPPNPPCADTVGDQEVMKVQIPIGLHPGDSFVVTPPDGRVFTVIVPEGAVAGAYVDILVPAEASVQKDEKAVTLKKSTIGALAVGGAVGMVFGPVGAVVMAAGALAAVSSKGKVGETAQNLGEKSYNGAASIKNWTFEKAGKLKDSITKKKNENESVSSNCEYKPL